MRVVHGRLGISDVSLSTPSGLVKGNESSCLTKCEVSSCDRRDALLRSVLFARGPLFLLGGVRFALGFFLSTQPVCLRFGLFLDLFLLVIRVISAIDHKFSVANFHDPVRYT